MARTLENQQEISTKAIDSVHKPRKFWTANENIVKWKSKEAVLKYKRKRNTTISNIRDNKETNRNAIMVIIGVLREYQ